MWRFFYFFAKYRGVLVGEMPYGRGSRLHISRGKLVFVVPSFLVLFLFCSFVDRLFFRFFLGNHL